jgi:hypothetical protein
VKGRAGSQDSDQCSSGKLLMPFYVAGISAMPNSPHHPHIPRFWALTRLVRFGRDPKLVLRTQSDFEILPWMLLTRNITHAHCRQRIGATASDSLPR